MSIDLTRGRQGRGSGRQINRLTHKDIDSAGRSLIGWPGFDRDLEFLSGRDRSMHARPFVSHEIKARSMGEHPQLFDRPALVTQQQRSADAVQPGSAASNALSTIRLPDAGEVAAASRSTSASSCAWR